MPVESSTITQETLKTSAAWAQAFRDYASSKGNMGNVELFITGKKAILPVFRILWTDFMNSEPARALLENPPKEGTPWYVPESKPENDSVPEITPIPRRTDGMPKDVEEWPQDQRDLLEQKLQETLKKYEDGEIPDEYKPWIPQDVSKPEGLPTPTQAPKAPVKEDTQILTSANPLFELIAQGLKGIDFVPEKALSAEQVTSIAENTALSIVNSVIDRLENEGRLGGKTQVIQYKINDRPVKELSGRTPAFFPELMKLVQCGIPAFLVGPAGSGKTTAVEKLAHVLDLSFTRVSLSAGVDEGILQGWLLPMELGGRFVYVPAPMVTAYEHGGVVLLDEIDSADANMLIILSAVLDNSAWHIPMRHDQPALVKSAHVHFVAAANTWGHGADHKFVGANQLDERTLSRFRQGQVACDYDADLEREEFHADVVEFGHMLRKRCRNIGQFKRDVSTRDIALNHQKVTTLDHTGKPVYTVAQAWFNHFNDWSTQELSAVHVERDASMHTVALL